jgi:hypothetical protein
LNREKLEFSNITLKLNHFNWATKNQYTIRYKSYRNLRSHNRNCEFGSHDTCFVINMVQYLENVAVNYLHRLILKSYIYIYIYINLLIAENYITLYCLVKKIMNLLKMLIHLALQSEAGKVWILFLNII